MLLSSKDLIHTRPCPNCSLCGGKGLSLYSGQKDKLFGVPGEWSLSECPSESCGLVWLNPCPLEEDIGKAYHSYYTHNSHTEKSFGGKLFSGGLRNMVTLLLVLTGQYSKRRSHAQMYLNKVLPGRLLEIGCGDGTFLKRMQDIGWTAEGLDFDPKAAQAARDKNGITVKVGKLEDVSYNENSFDAVTMSHVIEHVYDPIATMNEVRRILKPGGKITIVTPNAQSLGHKKFRENWRGLEPPRHIQIFSVTSLIAIASKAGFKNIEAFTSPVNAWNILNASYNLTNTSGSRQTPHQQQKITNIFKSMALQVRETVFSTGNLGEECVLICTKCPAEL